ncbi:allophanate hydrolase subunit 1 [Arthrobacter sp. CAU 1506]|uniref:5-oxoprolinase subunit B family protein n=1 Tax=Arthrobacter sp. CAU 1506 TaxID=2560052 RepID=UPI00145E6033|nr:allophanate hydrolase subunit 1 [Arthrobacter sp. CAU 1506]
MRVLPFGDAALLAEFSTLDDVMAHYRALSASLPPGVTELVPAARTILVTFAAPASRAVVRQWLEDTAPHDAEAGTAEDLGDIVTLEVDYSGQDLPEVARLLGVSEADVVRQHQHCEWTAAFTGFAPGFAYLVTPENPLQVPRLAEPRTRVPAGSVGLAGEFSGVYPSESPGGWQLIGRTDVRLWDATREQPALITPGTRVRFRAV